MNEKYYLDISAYESLSFKYDVNGIPFYQLGNNLYKGDLFSQSTNVNGFSNLIEISVPTFEMLYKKFENRVEIVDLLVYDVNQKEQFNDSINYIDPNSFDSGNNIMNK